MPREFDTSAEEVGRTIADLLKGSRLMPDIAEVWRAVGERQMRNRLRGERPGSQQAALPDPDPLALMLRANELVANAGVRMGLDWQRLVSWRLPAIRRRIDDYRAEADPLPEVRDALLDEVALFMTELAEFASDQGRALQRDIEVFQRRLLPGERTSLPGATPVPRKKIFFSAVEEQLATSTRDVARALRLEADMERLKDAIVRWRQRADPFVREMLDHQFDCDAKYFRPLTVFSCHRAISSRPVPDSLITSAQVVEMFHNVSLIIDDLVDRSEMRRGKPTMHNKYDELTAYMVAGYIVADGYDLLARQVVDECDDRYPQHPQRTGADLPNARSGAATTTEPSARSVFRKRYAAAKPDAMQPGESEPDLDWVGPVRFDLRLLSELLKRLAVAECLQWQNRKRWLGLSDWYWLAREDTGSMFEVCACLGARNQRLRRFGRLLGTLYHGCDDVADLFQHKDLGGGGDEDLEEGILTLPAALAIRDEKVRRLFESGDRKDETVKAKLLAAYKAQADNAHRELDRLADMAKREARAQSSAPEPLILLVAHTRNLAPRPASA